MELDKRYERRTAGIGPLMLGLTWTFASLGIIAVGLRMWARRTKGHGLDDWLMVVASVLMIVFQGLLVEGVRVGIGSRFNTDDNNFTATDEERINMRIYQLILQIFLTFQPVFSRWSIAVFLIRLFGKARIWYKRFLIFWVAFMAAGAITLTILTLAWYKPLSAYWDWSVLYEYRFNGNIVYCMTILVVCQAAVSDLAFSIIPVIFVWELQMHLHKKLALGALVGGSLLAFIASLCRIIFSIVWINTGSDYAEIAGMRSGGVFLIISGVEQGLVVMLGCLPALGPLVHTTTFQGMYDSLVYLITLGRRSLRTEFSENGELEAESSQAAHLEDEGTEHKSDDKV